MTTQAFIRRANSTPHSVHTPAPITAERHREIFGAMSTGVTIITCLDPFGLPIGMTVNAVTSLSLSPPQLLVCLQRGKYTGTLIRESARFGVNFLAADQAECATRFASGRPDKFYGIPWTPGFVTGAPHIRATAAFAECILTDVIPSGDHEIYIGDVVGGGHSTRAPLIYYNREFGEFVAKQ